MIKTILTLDILEEMVYDIRSKKSRRMRTLNNLESKISARMKPYYVARRAIGGGLKPFGPSHCILNALRVLFSGRNTIYLRPDEYPLAGISSQDPRVIESPLGRVVMMMGFASHRYHFNFSLTGLKDVGIISKYRVWC
jgi:hypothetical protein